MLKRFHLHEWKSLFILGVKVLLDYKFLDYFEVNRTFIVPRSGWDVRTGGCRTFFFFSNEDVQGDKNGSTLEQSNSFKCLMH